MFYSISLKGSAIWSLWRVYVWGMRGLEIGLAPPDSYLASGMSAETSWLWALFHIVLACLCYHFALWFEVRERKALQEQHYDNVVAFLASEQMKHRSAADRERS